MPINQHFNEIKCGLDTLDRVFNQTKLNYRVLGSVLIAAINQKPHRTLGDIDIMIEESQLSLVIDRLEQEGYEIIHQHKLGFSWLEAHRPNCLGFTFLLVGKFTPNYLSFQKGWLELRISNAYLAPTQYSLFGCNFIGIPVRSLYEGFKISDLNPKRKFDLEVIKRVYGTDIPQGESLEKSFRVYFKGIELPYLYPIFSRIYNLYGGLRVKFGKKYEIWD